jgi:hypothetical protein
MYIKTGQDLLGHSGPCNAPRLVAMAQGQKRTSAKHNGGSPVWSSCMPSTCLFTHWSQTYIIPAASLYPCLISTGSLQNSQLLLKGDLMTYSYNIFLICHLDGSKENPLGSGMSNPTDTKSHTTGVSGCSIWFLFFSFTVRLFHLLSRVHRLHSISLIFACYLNQIASTKYITTSLTLFTFPHTPLHYHDHMYINFSLIGFYVLPLCYILSLFCRKYMEIAIFLFKIRNSCNFEFQTMIARHQ